ncbi:MAG: VIT domain-containing protein [Acidobacteriota bacterium]
MSTPVPGIPNQQKSRWRSILRINTSKPPGVGLLLFGVVFPTITIIVELTTRMCAGAAFDPIPTIGHTVLVGMLPLANILVWYGMRKGSRSKGWLLELINGIAIGVAVFYSLLFIPLLPLAVIGLIVYGLGMLPLAPYYSLISTILLRLRLKKMLEGEKPARIPGLWLGLILSLSAFIAIEAPVTVTRYGLKLAASETAEASLRGIRMLRTLGQQETLLRACYQRPGRATDLIGFIFLAGDPVMPDKAREIFFRVYGKSFNSVPPPELHGREGDWEMFADFDSDQGGEQVGGRVKGLYLSSSRLDGTIDPDAALSYTEWTMVFKNDSQLQQEARAQITLPPEGVVSRLTLWVNGEEREAAFAGRGKVRAAYESVVNQRRDPVLITCIGPDRVLMQCFPVPPTGGEMKVRIGITAPLILENRENGLLGMPLFAERNFTIKEDLRHSVWYESKRALEIANKQLKVENAPNGVNTVKGLLKETELVDINTVIRAARASEITTAWTADPDNPTEYLIQQQLSENELAKPARVILVVDGSVTMNRYLPEVAEAITKLPEGIEFSLLFVTDEEQPVEISGALQQGTSDLYKTVAEKLKREQCEGGRDNVRAINKALDIALTSPNSTVVWIHGPISYNSITPDYIDQSLERRKDNQRLIEVQTENGPNRIMEKLDQLNAIYSLPRLGNLRQDLERFFATWRGEIRPIGFIRERKAKVDKPMLENAKETSSHLARLWAKDEIAKKLREPGNIEESIILASKYHLVTSVSGAVVLETAEQYRQADLRPVDANSVPTIPEPETWLLIGVVAIVLAWALYKNRFSARSV